MAKLREQQARDPWLLLWLWLWLRWGLRLRHARWRAEWVTAGRAKRVTAGRTKSAGTECSLSDRLADSRLLPLRIQSLLRVRCRFLERIPNELPLDILLAVVVDLLRRRIHFAGNAGQERAENRSVHRPCGLLQVRRVSRLTVQRTEQTLRPISGSDRTGLSQRTRLSRSTRLRRSTGLPRSLTGGLPARRILSRLIGGLIE